MADFSLSVEQLKSKNKGVLHQLIVEADEEIHKLIVADRITDYLADLLVFWLRARTAMTETNGYILGISGGIDSAVVAALVKRAIPMGNEYYFLSLRSVEQDKEDACLTAATIGIEMETVDLLPLYFSACKVFGLDSGDEAQLHISNLKAMFRSLFLNTIALQKTLLVAGTGNRGELEFSGNFAKWGDGAVDNTVLGHLFKGQVRQLARLEGVPESIINKTPTPGLTIKEDGVSTVTDEEILGMSYSEIETSTRLFMEFGRDLDLLEQEVRQRCPGNAKRMLSVCKQLGLMSWIFSFKNEPVLIAGNPRKVIPVYDDYKKGFPYPNNLLRRRW